MFHIEVVEKITTQYFTWNRLFSENRALYELMSKNMVQPDRPQMTVKYGACALHAG